MSYREKLHHIKIPLELGGAISHLNIPGSQNERAIWLIKEGMAAHPELQPNETLPHSVPRKNSEKNPATQTAQDD
jgi:hypothetical protein